MTWIDDDYEELKRHRQVASERAVREGQIADEAERVYNDLWKEITERLAEAKEKNVAGTLFLTNGSPFQRSIIACTQNGARRSYGLTLAADKQSIVLSKSEGKNLVLLLELGEDGVVSIRQDGEAKWIGDVAKSILRPLLFPELFDFSHGVKPL
jgi:hypothetical protein